MTEIIVTILFAILTFFVAVFPVFMELHVMWREWKKRAIKHSKHGEKLRN